MSIFNCKIVLRKYARWLVKYLVSITWWRHWLSNLFIFFHGNIDCLENSLNFYFRYIFCLLPFYLQHQRKPLQSVRLQLILLRLFGFLLFLTGLIFRIFRLLPSELTTTDGKFDTMLLLCTDFCFQSKVSLVLFQF